MTIGSLAMGVASFRGLDAAGGIGRASRQAYIERGTSAFFGFDPHAPAMPLDNPADNGQPHSFARRVGGMDSLESLEDFFVIGIGDAQPVVPDEEGDGRARFRSVCVALV